MANPLLLLPDFLLILIGWIVCRRTSLDRTVWDAAERLVYYLLFPVLLFNSIVRSPLQPAQALSLAVAGLGTTLGGIALAHALRLVPGVDARLHASGAQTVFRFNSFIALALSERLGGPAGLAWMALLIALSVPLANVAAVWPLARHGGHSYARELLRNPLILSTIAGLLANIGGLQLPEAVTTTLQRIGVAALPVGLMAVGAGLQFGRLKASPGLAAALLGLRHAAMPMLRRRAGHGVDPARHGDDPVLAGAAGSAAALTGAASACASAQSMCSRTTASAPSRRACNASTIDASKHARSALPSATAMLRCQRTWPMRRIALPSVARRNSASLQLHSSSSEAAPNGARASKSATSAGCAYLFHGHTSWQSSQP